MNYIQVFKDAFNLVRRTKLIWVFNLFNLLSPLFSYIYINNLALRCFMTFVGLGLSYIGLCAQGGLFFIIHQAITQNLNISFKDGWNQGKIKWLRIAGVLLIQLFILILIGILLFVLTREFSKIILLIVVLPIWAVWINLAYCGVVIDELKPIRAIWTGLLILTNNIIKIIVLYLSIEVVRLFLFGVIIIAMFFTPLRSNIPLPFTLDYSTYIKLITNLIIGGFYQSINFIIVPLETTVWVIAYNQFTREISYPGLASRHEKAHPEIQNSML
jgi:hypothetical protein